MTVVALVGAGTSACQRAVPPFPSPVRSSCAAPPSPPEPSPPDHDPGQRDHAARVAWVHAPAADRAELDGWCAGVGPAVVQPAHIADTVTTAPRLEQLAVVSWNTNVGGGDLHGLVNDLRAGRLTGGDRTTHFVLLLQEVFRAGEEVPRGMATRPRRIAPRPRDGERHDVLDVATRHGLHLFYVPSMANGWDGSTRHAEDRGNAILSTLPLSELTAIELPFEGQRRVAASATLLATGADGHRVALRVVSVHLDNRSGLRRFLHSFGRGRTRQAESLASALRSDSTAPVPTVLAGDLNTWAPAAWERAVRVLRAHFPHGNEMRVPTFAGPPMGLGRTLDHMMFHLPSDAPPSAQDAGAGEHAAEPRRGPTFAPPRAVRLDDARGSDHYPLLTRLSLIRDR